MGRMAKAAGFAVLFVFGLPRPSAPESLTLTTYYPAPYGVYQELRASRNTYLAYQTPLAGAQPYKVGIGTTQPGSKLSVKGAMSVGAGYERYKQGADTSGNPIPEPAGWDPNPNPDGLIVSGRVGIGVSNPTYSLQVEGQGRFQKSIKYEPTTGGLGANDCVFLRPSLVGGMTSCGSVGNNYYATWTAGLYHEGQSHRGVPMYWVFFSTVIEHGPQPAPPSGVTLFPFKQLRRPGADAPFMCCPKD
ncbi:MAG: hypothetical protein WC728_09825 [Elusimicrobiota bacterium]